MKLVTFMALLVSLQISPWALAQGNYKLSCDDNNIFETPLVIETQNHFANAQGEFSGPGDAIFDVDLKGLKIESLQLSADQKQIEALSLTGHQFSLRLQNHGKSKLKGQVNMVSTDSDHMPYSGTVECEYTEF